MLKMRDNAYIKCKKALFEYLKGTSVRCRFYYILVYEYEPFNTKVLYKLELEDSPEKRL